MKPPYSLVADHLSHNTVRALEQLLDEAREGNIIGLAFVAMRRRQEFITDTAGECRRNPVFTRGMVAALDDELRDMVHR